jgi:hypothetical protein
VIINSNLGGAGRRPSRNGADLLLAASIDIEWTKNYKIKNGNVPFCWSVTWFQIPASGVPTTPPAGFDYTSAYVGDTGETQDLIDAADAEITAILNSADVIIGHQLSSDLAILKNASKRQLPGVQALRDLWHQRRNPSLPAVVDSRYDAGDILTGTSRRLVDVCTELHLDVTQPELARTSMTGLHRVWLNDGDPAARERITVLNLRHGLSAAYVALRSTGHSTWNRPINLNQTLHEQLAGTFDWLDTPTFQQLL